MLHDFGKKSPPGTDLTKKLKQLASNGQFPKKGTMRREALSNEVCKLLYYCKNQIDKPAKQAEFDSDDEVIN
jgi:hypothetical protein